MSPAPAAAARSAQLCRLTVHGPSGRADLAVPMTATVVDLLPQVSRFVVRADDVPDGVAEHGSWVLQRLGEPPAGPDETPASLGWLDGDQVHLVPAADSMPELDFDDVADGIATTVSRHPDRWGATSQRWTFAALAALAAADVVAIAVRSPGGWFPFLTVLVLTLGLGCAAVLLARRGDAVLAGLAAAAAPVAGWTCAGAWLEGGRIVLHPTTLSLTTAAVGAAATAGLLLAARRLLAPGMPLAPPAVALATAAGTFAGVLLHAVFGFETHRAATLVACVWFAGLLSAPKLAVRIARIRAPQLPRDGAELRIDDEPLAAADLAARTKLADTTLTGLAVGAGVSFLPLFVLVLAAGGWLAQTITAVLTVLLAMRAREFRSFPQRLALLVAVVAGGWLLTADVVQPSATPYRVLAVIGLAVAATACLLTARRPLHRRLLPVWRHVVNTGEVLLAVTLVPLLCHQLGLFSWARGLAG